MFFGNLSIPKFKSCGLSRACPTKIHIDFVLAIYIITMVILLLNIKILMTDRNGDMPGCLWKECPTKCCKPKKKTIFDGKSGHFFQDTDGKVKYEWPSIFYVTTLTQEEKITLDKQWLEITTHSFLVFYYFSGLFTYSHI